jgi:hypothetical protein
MGDKALVCNAVGNDFSIVDCPLGCDEANGCKTCSTSEQCANPDPVCDPTSNTCRTCAKDNECASNVCSADGACLAETDVVYASSNGSDSSDCSQANPCSLNRTLMVAVAANPRPVVRLLPGVFATTLSVPPSATAVEIVATDATIAALTAVSVKDGARAKIRGLTMVSLNFGIDCGTTASPKSSLEIRDSVISNGDNLASLVAASNCSLDISRSELRLGNSDGGAIAVGTDTTFVGDRLHISGAINPEFGTFGQRVSVKLTNSVLDNVLFLFNTNDTAGTGSQISVAYSTLVMTSQFNDLLCPNDSGTPFRHLLFENNIIVALGSTAALEGTGCTMTNNILSPQASPPATNIVADPQFVDVVAKDFRVRSGSPAIDAAKAPSTIFSDHAFDGTPRPVGPKPDIGAFEQ